LPCLRDKTSIFRLIFGDEHQSGMITVSELYELVGLRRNSKSGHEILTAIKEQGLTMMEAIKASMQLVVIALGDAMSLVSSHPFWILASEAAEPLHNELIQAFRDASNSATHPK
jgi:hypothetical protein